MTRWTVRFSDGFLDAVRERFPLARSLDYTGPTYGEFMAGPVVAARDTFAYAWDRAVSDIGDAVRTVDEFSAVFGPLVFYGALVGERTVEIAGFEYQPDYWEMIENDPEE